MKTLAINLTYQPVGGALTQIIDMIASSGKTLVLEVLPQLLRGNDISRIYGSRAKLDELLSRIPEGRNYV